MKCEKSGQINFISEMSESQINVKEFFSDILISSLSKNFDLDNILIYYFDTKGKFNSWVSSTEKNTGSLNNPYQKIIKNDVIRHLIYDEALQDNLTYFNTTPRLYKSSDIISKEDYDSSAYIKFINQYFKAHYSLSMAFGINAYIQISFFKSKEENDFSDEEIIMLNKIYIFIAKAYKNFKKHEQAKIVSIIQNEVISLGEKAYIITDCFMHVLSYNEMSLNYLSDIWGVTIANQITSKKPCNWLSFLNDNTNQSEYIIKDYTFKTRNYAQKYSNGIIDNYCWVTIAKNNETEASFIKLDNILTKAEQRVAKKMCKGMTYQNIADEFALSYHTIKKHVQNIYIKCGVTNRFDLCKYLEKNQE